MHKESWKLIIIGEGEEQDDLPELISFEGLAGRSLKIS